MEDARIEYLKARLQGEDFTLDELREYCWLTAPLPAQGQVRQDMATFITDDARVGFLFVRNWWRPVEPKPAVLPLPQVDHFLLGYITMPGGHATTMNEAIIAFYRRATKYCKDNKIDPTAGTEDPAARAKRLNRERVARSRSKKPTGERMLTDSNREQVRALEQHLATARERFDAEDERLAAVSKHHYDAMLEASKSRKSLKEFHDMEVTQLIAEKQALIRMQG
jgi:hypothetical protein